MITLDLSALEAFVLTLSVANLLFVIAFLAYSLGWERGSRSLRP